jgi:hypothetical protein
MRRRRKPLLVLLAVVAVLGVGAVSAYAGLADDVTPPVTTSDAAETYWNDAVVNLSATDDEGVAYIYNELDNGVVRLHAVNGGAAQTDAPHEWYRPLKPGKHTLRFWSQDVNGNVETPQTVKFAVKTDKTAPVTSAAGADEGGWYRASVAVTLTATDPGDGSGVVTLEYVIDGGAPTVVSAASAVAVLAVDAATVNGPHVFTFKATDLVGNVESPKALTVNIDTVSPTTSAPSAARVVKGRTATLKYAVADAEPNAGEANVIVRIRNRSGKIVQTLNAGQVAVNAPQAVKFRCRLARGTYKYSVYATDMVGNAQSKIGSNKLVVK